MKRSLAKFQAKRNLVWCVKLKQPFNVYLKTWKCWIPFLKNYKSVLITYVPIKMSYFSYFGGVRPPQDPLWVQQQWYGGWTIPEWPQQHRGDPTALCQGTPQVPSWLQRQSSSDVSLPRKSIHRTILQTILSASFWVDSLPTSHWYQAYGPYLA